MEDDDFLVLENKQTSTSENSTAGSTTDSYRFEITILKEHYIPISWMYYRGWGASALCSIEFVILNQNSFYCLGYASRPAMVITFHVLFRKE